MSAPTSSRYSADLTRQQLDELDALLQRMLELPVHPTEESVPAAPSPAAAVSVMEPEPVSPPPPAPRLELPTPAPVAWRPLPEEPSVDDQPPPPAWAWPLLVLNRAFDEGARRLGKPGRWLRRPIGRLLLGWAGLTFLAAALALLVYDWVRTRW